MLSPLASTEECQIVAWFKIVQPNEPNLPDQLTLILTLRANPTQLNPILDPEGPTQPENGSGWVQIGFIK